MPNGIENNNDDLENVINTFRESQLTQKTVDQ